MNVIKLLPEADNLFDLFRLYGEGDEMPTNTVDDFLEYKVVWHGMNFENISRGLQ